MSNQFHVELLKGTKETFDHWRAENKDTPLDVSGGVDLSGVDISGWELAAAHFQGANLTKANLQGTNLTKANLTEATLINARLQGADLTGANLTRAKFHVANLTSACLHDANLENTEFQNCVLQGADLSNTRGPARFSDADLTSANLCRAGLAGSNFQDAVLHNAQSANASFREADLVRASFRNADLTSSILIRAQMGQCDLSGAHIKGTNFTEARVNYANFLQVKGTVHAKGLDSVRLDDGCHELYFDTCERSWIERRLDWERIRGIGRFQLFGVSYTLLIYLISVFYIVGQYNEKIELAREWAAQQTFEMGSPRWATTLGDTVTTRLHVFSIDRSSVILLVSTLLLVAASVVYTVFCPEEVKDFTRVQWCYQLNRSLVHYWARAWMHRRLRTLCGFLYAIGGVSFLGVTSWKLGAAVFYIWKYVGVNSPSEVL